MSDIEIKLSYPKGQSQRTTNSIAVALHLLSDWLNKIYKVTIVEVEEPENFDHFQKITSFQRIKGELKMSKDAKTAAPAGAIYGLGFIGALVFFISHACSIWAGIFGFFKALVWPAFLVYHLFKHTTMSKGSGLVFCICRSVNGSNAKYKT